MINWRLVVTSLLLGSAVISPHLSPARGSAADSRYVSIGATCLRDISSDSLLPTVEVAIENESGLPLHIAYLQAFGTSPDRETELPGLKLEDPGVLPVQEVPAGKSVNLEAVWGGVELTRGHEVVVLAVTSAGAFLASCSDTEPRTYAYEKTTTPVKESDEAAESAQIAALMIGQLEAWRAYPALYSLIHPDVREKISFTQITCWYTERYGPPVTDKVQTIFSTAVSKVAFADWTWKVTGTEFKDSAEITYSQTSGIAPDQGEPVEAEMHLVRTDGLWRWFFGSSAEGVAGLSDSCTLPETT